MKGTKIDFRWIYKGKEYNKQLERNDMYVVFQGLVNGFQDDNEISKKMIEKVIPVADSILIDKDLNAQRDVPSIIYKVDDQSEMLKIIRYHKIVWAILDKYCTE